MFGISDPFEAYNREVAPHCPYMLCTDADGDIRLFTPQGNKEYKVQKIQTVSTIGAGDNFNAGIVFGLLQSDTKRDDLNSMANGQWSMVINHGVALATEVCQSIHNSISKDFAQQYIKKLKNN